jgi:hypothetical protein
METSVTTIARIIEGLQHMAKKRGDNILKYTAPSITLIALATV